MTYLTKTRRQVPQQAMGSIFDTLSRLVMPSEERKCLDAANEKVAPLDAKITDLAKNWRPTGFYTSQNVRDLVAATMATVRKAQEAIDQARSRPNASQDSLMRASNDLFRAGERSLVFLDIARQADSMTDVEAIEAQGLKRWVTDTLAAASSGFVTASVVECLTPWWLVALVGFQNSFEVAYTTAKRIVGVVIKIGETALKVAEDLPDLYEIAKWVAIAGGVGWLAIELMNLRDSGKSLL